MSSRPFSPPWWARSPHIQTILPVLTKVPRPALHRERLELEDGDFIDLDWCGNARNGDAILVLIHGLEGSSDSHYIRRLLHQCQRHDLTATVHHHRSCSGEPNRLARSYHSGDTADLAVTLNTLRIRFPDSPLYACGYSLGGNVLIKYLGEQAQQSLLSKAVVVSAPLKLEACAQRLRNGFSRVYQNYLIGQLQAKALAKINHPVLRDQMPVSADMVGSLISFHQFDNAITAPLHGFHDVDDYYRRASGMPYLERIRIPTLIIHAGDDPFMTDAVIPTNEMLSDTITYELHPRGGHVGFINGGLPWQPRYYLEPRIMSFLSGDSPC